MCVVYDHAFQNLLRSAVIAAGVYLFCSGPGHDEVAQSYLQEDDALLIQEEHAVLAQEKVYFS